jgi:hypothetical protein
MPVIATSPEHGLNESEGLYRGTRKQSQDSKEVFRLMWKAVFDGVRLPRGACPGHSPVARNDRHRGYSDRRGNGPYFFKLQGEETSEVSKTSEV